ncbi:MAG: hypothetical protein ACW97X_15055 [Candidatus Hodarchaeales archaeon]|jgi:hypothetical protein
MVIYYYSSSQSNTKKALISFFVLLIEENEDLLLVNKHLTLGRISIFEKFAEDILEVIQNEDVGSQLKKKVFLMHSLTPQWLN